MITLQHNNDISYDEWLSARFNSIGASEVSPICFGSQYTSNIEIYYSKISGIRKDIRNIHTYRGHKSENIVDQFYPYYEGTEDSIVLNEHVGKFIRKIENRNVTGRNSKFVHITATPDRFILPFGNYKTEGLAEYKSTTDYVLKRYKPNLPIEHVIQVLTQLNTFEIDHGELFYYIDSKRFELHEMERGQFKKQWLTVLDITTDFWKRVTEGRKLYNQMCEYKRTFNMKAAAEAEAEIQRLEPPIQHSQGYLSFINENYKSRAALGAKEANAAQIEKAKRYAALTKQQDKIKKEKLALEIELKNSMQGATVINMGKSGNISWQQYENRQIFKVNYK